jgi:hypothetical protein
MCPAGFYVFCIPSLSHSALLLSCLHPPQISV